MNFIFCSLHRQCLVLAIVCLVWWLGVMALAIFYSALGDEQDAREVYFDMMGMTGKGGHILFFPVTPFSLYVTVKLAFIVSCVMIAGSSCLILAVFWRNGNLCLVYICAVIVSGAGQVLVILIFWDDPPLPSFWYILEMFIAYCAWHLRASLNFPAIEDSRYYEAYTTTEAHPANLNQNTTEDIIFANDSAENSDKIDEEAQVEGKKRRKRHRRHRRSYNVVDEEVPAAGAENGLDENLNSAAGAKNAKCGG